MPPIAASPTRIKTPVRIRFFNFDFWVRLISITSNNFGPLARSFTVLRRKENQGLCHRPQDSHIDTRQADLCETTEGLMVVRLLLASCRELTLNGTGKKVSLAGYASPIFANPSAFTWTSNHYVVGRNIPRRIQSRTNF